MADIDVVKKGSRAWLWILMLVILAVIIWVAMGRNNPQTENRTNEGGQPHRAAAVGLASGVDGFRKSG